MTAKNAEARPLGRAAHPLPHAELPPRPLITEIFGFVHCSNPCWFGGLPIIGRAISNLLFGCRFARLDLHVFALVADSLAFIGLGLAERTQLGGELADLLLVRTLN